MTEECYTSVTRAINAGRWACFAVLFLSLAALVRAEEPAVATPPTSPLSLAAAHVRAHPNASGPVVLTRHVHAHDRTTSERGTLHLAPAGARLSLGTLEIAMSPDAIESFDGAADPPRILVLRGESPLSRYAAIVAGEDPSATFHERELARDATHVRVELVPAAAWLGLERAVLRIVLTGPDAGRIDRCLWLDGLGNWHRLDLDAVTHPAQLDPRRLLLSPHPGVRRVEI